MDHRIRLHLGQQRENINKLKYIYGRAPAAVGECVLDGRYFGNDVIGKTVKITDSNPAETKGSFAVNELTVVGVATSPYYLNYERGTTKLGDGSVAALAASEYVKRVK